MLPVELRGSRAGQYDAVQVDELTELLGQSIQIELGRGRELLRRAAGVNGQEVGLALQRVEPKNALFTPQSEVGTNRLVPANRPARTGRRQLRCFQRSRNKLPAVRRLRASGKLDRAGGDRRVAADSQGVRQHRCQPRHIDRSAQLQIKCGRIWGLTQLVRTNRAACRELSDVARHPQVVDHDAILLRRETPRQFDTRQLQAVAGEYGCGRIESIDRQCAAGGQILRKRPAAGRPRRGAFAGKHAAQLRAGDVSPQNRICQT